ncbi:MAG: AMP-binding protein [Bacteroides sp.]|nr:AMP-binding protein [Eubacterium sp.]MCM1417279.1 AMP-binding protein [Roseburia sp.]MCM1461101.1 AMP-binding protein [Bacteroides sp.]
MEEIKNYYKRFVTEGFDENGILDRFELSCPENYNFAYDIIDRFGELNPDRPALLHVDLEGNETRFSYRRLSELSSKAAHFFLSLGIRKGDKVMLVLKRNYQFWYAFIGLMKIGAVIIPATHLLTTHDFTYRFTSAEVKAILCTGYNPDIEKFVDEAEEELNISLIKMIANGKKEGWLSFDDEIQKFPSSLERIETSSYDHMLLYFTSGTTGYPKMVVHNHRYALCHIQTAVHWQNVDSDGIHLTVSDTGWGKAVWGKLFGQMSVGACVFVYDFDKFVPSDMLNILQKYKVTSFCAPPTMYRFFIKEGLEKYDLSSLKYSAIAGEALNPEVYNRWLEFTGLKLMEAFGQTESTVILANLVGTTPKPGSMGKPSPLYEVDIVDENDVSVHAGEVGEIVIRAERGKDGLFCCYYKDEELTNETWCNGVYHTGDTAWRDEDGYYWYVGRNDDVIKASGYRIGPFEIESVLIQHPSVLECAVTGTPDPIRGQVVKATIVLAKGYTASDALTKELQNYVKKNTAPYKYPRVIEYVEELPKTISGKIRRVQIREEDQKAVQK